LASPRTPELIVDEGLGAVVAKKAVGGLNMRRQGCRILEAAVAVIARNLHDASNWQIAAQGLHANESCDTLRWADALA